MCRCVWRVPFTSARLHKEFLDNIELLSRHFCAASMSLPSDERTMHTARVITMGAMLAVAVAVAGNSKDSLEGPGTALPLSLCVKGDAENRGYVCVCVCIVV